MYKRQTIFCFIHLKKTSTSNLYRHRWDVEVFFKWIKQNIVVKNLWGYSDVYKRQVRNFAKADDDVNTGYFYRRFDYRTNFDFTVTDNLTMRLDFSSRFMNINEPSSPVSYTHLDVYKRQP